MYEQLMEQAVERENRVEALRAVMRNDGSPGIDRMTVKELKEHVAKHWESIREKTARWELHSQSSQTGRYPETWRRDTYARNTDGDGPLCAAIVVRGVAANL